jgi:hypothetical protein
MLAARLPILSSPPTLISAQLQTYSNTHTPPIRIAMGKFEMNMTREMAAVKSNLSTEHGEHRYKHGKHNASRSNCEGT